MIREKGFILAVPIVLLALATGANAQQTNTTDGFTVLPIRVIGGDTLPNALIERVVVATPRRFRSARDLRQYRRLIHNLRVVYPYSQVAKQTMAEIAYHIRTLDTERQRRAYINRMERLMMAQFEAELRNLTISQGRLLIKLIDRELGRTTFDVIRELRGGFSAHFWQTLARVFGTNLRTEFDAAGEDRLLDELIMLHEMGLL